MDPKQPKKAFGSPSLHLLSISRPSCCHGKSSRDPGRLQPFLFRDSGVDASGAQVLAQYTKDHPIMGSIMSISRPGTCPVPMISKKCEQHENQPPRS